MYVVRIGCQRSTYGQNSSFPSFVYCGLLLSLTSMQGIPPFCFTTHANLDSTVNDRVWPCFDLYKTPPNAVLLQSMLGCSVGLVLAHPFSGLVSDRLFGLVLARSFSVLNLSYLCLCRLWRWLHVKGPCVCLQFSWCIFYLFNICALRK